ncbi:Fip1-domain-containing protein [Dacryopinax primogenitus]|uniref:Fip1-domain-containing protein n=1 Tax=Dacryopinax primogenitus (strain DJM 731) TaxID=1858805 RepID=M5G2B6_DACPD|nr:Fip1-domain-containing protein [Dacryopinax primogenitus]EJU02834.1 Fip1-domain-containing protein [Dacryopinax primogenitus]
MDEDDAFLYGDEEDYPSVVEAPSEQPPKDPEPNQSIPGQLIVLPNGPAEPFLVASVPAVVVAEDLEEPDELPMEHSEGEGKEGDADGEEEGEEEDEEEDRESEDDDLEIILQPQPRSIDFRDPSHQRPVRPPVASPAKASSLLTTEYTPRERDTSISIPKSTGTPQSTNLIPVTDVKQISTAQVAVENRPIPDGPPPRAASNAPEIDPSASGMLDARSIYEVEIQSLAEKPWRRPGSDLSDWFNYGFDEISWEAYCMRKKELSELSTALKQNVIAYTGMPENQLLALPPEMRTMAINSANMANTMPIGMAQNIMGGMPGIPAGDMMGMPAIGMAGMQPVQQNMMGTAMGPEHSIHMHDNMTGNVQGQGPSIEGMASEGFPYGYSGVQITPGAPVGGSDTNTPGIAQFSTFTGGYGVDASGSHGDHAFPARTTARHTTLGGRGSTPVRGTGVPVRGRGRGAGFAAGENMSTLPTRPASPLPPNVPTGPRNRTTYKDKDREPVKQDVEGLDYGGGIVVEPATSSRKRPYIGEEETGRSKRR